MDDKWPARNAKDAFIEFCLQSSIGETTEELDDLWGEYCASIENIVKEATDDPPSLS